MTLAAGWVDIGLASLLLLSVIVGLVRGFVFELLSLAGWFAAYFAAQWLTPLAVTYVPVGVPDSALNHGIAFACLFLLTLVAWSLAARLVRLLVHATPLSPIDRVLGAGFGVLRGMVVLLVLATAIAFTPLATSPVWQASQGAAWLNTLLQSLVPVMPAVTLPHRSA
ncbi:MAG: CvpA family protein [Burkholderiaceae bacterium]